jgi:hypothetical protein
VLLSSSLFVGQREFARISIEVDRNTEFEKLENELELQSRPRLGS